MADVASQSKNCQDLGLMSDTPENPLKTHWKETRELLQRALQEWDSAQPSEKSPLQAPPIAPKQREKLEELFTQLQIKIKELSE